MGNWEWMNLVTRCWIYLLFLDIPSCNMRSDINKKMWIMQFQCRIASYRNWTMQLNKLHVEDFCVKKDQMAAMMYLTLCTSVFDVTGI